MKNSFFGFFFCLLSLFACVSTSTESRFSINETNYHLFLYDFEAPDGLSQNEKEAAFFDALSQQLLKNYSATPEVSASAEARELIRDLVELAFYQYKQIESAGEGRQNVDFLLLKEANQPFSKGNRFRGRFAVKKTLSIELYRKFEWLGEKKGLRGWSSFEECYRTERAMVLWAAKNLSVRTLSVFQKYLNQIETQVRSVGIQPISMPFEFELGKPLLGNAVIRLRNLQGLSMENVAVEAIWKDQISGKWRWQSQKRQTDADGRASFGGVVFHSKEAGQVTFRFLTHFLDDFEAVQDKRAVLLLTELDKVIRRNSFTVNIPLHGETGAATVPAEEAGNDRHTAVLFIQFDSAGMLTESRNVGQMVTDPMGEAGKGWFLADFPADSAFLAKKEGALSEAAENRLLAALPSSVRFLVLGVVSLVNYQVEGEIFTVSTEGVVRVLNRDGSLVYQTRRTASSRGNRFQTVMDLSWRSLGKNLANDLKENRQQAVTAQ